MPRRKRLHKLTLDASGEKIFDYYLYTFNTPKDSTTMNGNQVKIDREARNYGMIIMKMGLLE